MKNKLLGFLGLGAPVLAFAEGETTTTAIDSSALIGDWVTAANTQMSGWGSSLTPLFTLGIGIVLMIVAWKLFKRVTKSAS